MYIMYVYIYVYYFMFLLQEIFSLPRLSGNVLSSKVNDSMVIRDSTSPGVQDVSMSLAKSGEHCYLQDSPQGCGKELRKHKFKNI